MIQPPTIDESRNNLITNFGKAVLQDRYMMPEEKNPQESLARAAVAFADSDAHAKSWKF